MGGNTILRKDLAAGIVLLFIGTCIIPASDDITIRNKIKNDNQDIAEEKITFVHNTTKALITPRFIIGMVDF